MHFVYLTTYLRDWDKGTAPGIRSDVSAYTPILFEHLSTISDREIDELWFYSFISFCILQTKNGCLKCTICERAWSMLLRDLSKNELFEDERFLLLYLLLERQQCSFFDSRYYEDLKIIATTSGFTSTM